MTKQEQADRAVLAALAEEVGQLAEAAGYEAVTPSGERDNAATLFDVMTEASQAAADITTLQTDEFDAMAAIVLEAMGDTADPWRRAKGERAAGALRCLMHNALVWRDRRELLAILNSAAANFNFDKAREAAEQEAGCEGQTAAPTAKTSRPALDTADGMAQFWREQSDRKQKQIESLYDRNTRLLDVIANMQLQIARLEQAAEGKGNSGEDEGKTPTDSRDAIQFTQDDRETTDGSSGDDEAADGGTEARNA